MNSILNSNILVLFVIVLVIGAVLIFAFRKKLTKRRICLMAIITVVVAVLVVVGALCIFDSSFAKDYLDDLRIELTQNDGTIVIKEWQFMTESGAEIYYEKDGDCVHLGSTVGNDGYLAFDDGKYQLDEADGEITIKWLYSKISGKENWKSETFKLAED